MSNRPWLAAIGVGLLLPVVQSAAAVPDAPAAAPVNAIWARQELLFYYAGHRALYSCHAIEQKVRAVLLDMGAKPDLKVHASGCAPSLDFESRSVRPPGRPPQAVISLPSKARGDVRVNIEVAVPMELTPALVAVLQQRQGERELISRIEGEPGGGATIKAFPALRQQARLAMSSRDLDDGDCELIAELARQVFPKIGVRAGNTAARCAASQSSSRGAQARLQAEALIAVAEAAEFAVPLRDASAPR
jgi:hypothetical protein